jgi:FkbM family methyltransferase
MYARTFSRPRLSSVNDFLLRTCLKARGYNNYASFEMSGEKHFLERVLPSIQPEFCVDVGANIGEYASKLLALESVTRVYAFSGRLVAVNLGVGESCETRTIHYDPAATALASLCSENQSISFISNWASAEIGVTTLDHHFCQSGFGEKIDFIKIDTEGFEYEVLAGAQSVIATYRPRMIQVEQNIYHLLRNQTIHRLAKLVPGYVAFQMLPSCLTRRDTLDPLANLSLFSNFVFVREDIANSL